MPSLVAVECDTDVQGPIFIFIRSLDLILHLYKVTVFGVLRSLLQKRPIKETIFILIRSLNLILHLYKVTVFGGLNMGWLWL